jgi:hypothetical protein
VKKLRILILLYFLIPGLSGCADKFTFINTKTLNEYPSGSGITCLHERIFLIGDDVNYMLSLDTAFNTIEKIPLSDSGQERIPKQLKADLEAATIVHVNRSPQILLAGSGSLSPNRNFGWLVDPANNNKIKLDLNIYYGRLRKAGIDALNIEGLATVPSGIVMASRGNRSFPSNYLVFTSGNFWEQQDSAAIKICKVGTNPDTTAFQGVSGLEYSVASDRLLLTVSTENTFNTLDDGAIGKSYLWIINNISTKKNMVAVNPDRVIDLDEMDQRFKGHKIESVCIIRENKKEMQLALVADDDKGTSILFKVDLKK